MNLAPSGRLRVALVLAIGLWAAAWGPLADAAPECPPAARPLTPEQMQAGLKAARDRGFLWRIRKDGRTSYLYGTIHIARVDWIFPGPSVVDAARSSDLIALELDLMDPDIVQRLRAGMAPRPERALPPPLAQRLHAQLLAACLPEQLASVMSPEMLATTLVVMSARSIGLDPAYAIDMVVAGLGHSLNKTVLSLETPEQQLELLQGHSREETRAIVEQALDDLDRDKARAALERIAEAWAGARLGELEHYDQWCDCRNTPQERAYQKRLLDDRNPALAERIDALHRGGKSVFAAVGSLHLIGKLGLPSLLAQRGYQVERVEFSH